MKLTLIHPCIGRRIGEPYIRTWQMEPLAPAVLAGLTPPDVEITFYDDRMEQIDYDQPADLVAISIETYTARRAYQIAAAYRRRGIPVVMGGFHATLLPDEVRDYADAVVVGEVEGLWPQVIADARRGALQPLYRQSECPSLRGIHTDRSIFAGKRYLPIGLVEAGRGCMFSCDFCSIHAFFGSQRRWRPPEEVVAELRQIKKPLIFFVDDNITANREQAIAFFRALIPLNIRWVSQASITVAHDDELLRLIQASGCQGLLIGFETLDAQNLQQMGKTFNMMRGGYEAALANLRRHGVRLYATFVLGYDNDTPQTLDEIVTFAKRHRFYIAAFNHLTPFPGTPLYERLEQEGRLLFDRWWLHPDYRYGMVPFTPQGIRPEEVSQGCVDARLSFYSLRSILARSMDFQVNSTSLFMWSNFFLINWMIRREVLQRRGFPLGDEGHGDSR